MIISEFIHLGMDQKALKMLSREIANMDTVRHPAIVRYESYHFLPNIPVRN